MTKSRSSNFDPEDPDAHLVRPPLIRWHPITIEQLDPDARVFRGEPAHTGKYLVTVRGKACDYVTIETFFGDDGWERLEPDDVLAWAPLPKPYQEK